VTSAKQVMRIIQKGETNRHISTTDYNKHSSRSHTIFQMVTIYIYIYIYIFFFFFLLFFLIFFHILILNNLDH